jgi:hypothetical protein
MRLQLLGCIWRDMTVMWVMIFSILVHGGQWVQIQDSPNGANYLDMRFESREMCTDAALAREFKLIEAGLIAQFKCVQREAQKVD